MIWVLTGRVLRSAREKRPGRSTKPSTVSRQFAKPFASWRLNSSVGGATGLAKGALEIMVEGNSRAWEWGERRRWPGVGQCFAGAEGAGVIGRDEAVALG